ncbi:MAG: SAM-dependent methyltransferase [bacterium]|jgi:SAM-dependent methyltransferase
MSSSHRQEDLIAHYQSLLKTHGDSAQSLQYRDSESQFARFKILSEIANPLDSVLDVGCGLAHLYHYLKSTGFTGNYLGVDIVPEFTAMASQNLKDDKCANVVLGSGLEPLPSGMDYVMLSGVFNNKMDDNQGFMHSTLERMFNAAEKGISFNAMSSYVDYKDEELYYVDPMDIFAFCKTKLGGHPVLRHDYVVSKDGYPFEFAMYVYKQAVR